VNSHHIHINSKEDTAIKRLVIALQIFFCLGRIDPTTNYINVEFYTRMKTRQKMDYQPYPVIKDQVERGILSKVGSE
jgi:hypothetical protein